MGGDDTNNLSFTKDCSHNIDSPIIGSHLVSDADLTQNQSNRLFLSSPQSNPFKEVKVADVKYPIKRSEFLERYEFLMTMQEQEEIIQDDVED